jgi:hypothetical protein
VSLDIQAKLVGCCCFCCSRSWVNVTLPLVAGRPEVLWCMRRPSLCTSSDLSGASFTVWASFTGAVMLPQISDHDLSSTALVPCDNFCAVDAVELSWSNSSSLSRSSGSLWETRLLDMVARRGTARHSAAARRCGAGTARCVRTRRLKTAEQRGEKRERALAIPQAARCLIRARGAPRHGPLALPFTLQRASPLSKLTLPHLRGATAGRSGREAARLRRARRWSG